MDASDPSTRHEAFHLNVATEKAFHFLGWRAVWDFATTVRHTAEWYRCEGSGEPVHDLTVAQIERYSEDARAFKVSWAL